MGNLALLEQSGGSLQAEFPSGSIQLGLAQMIKGPYLFLCALSINAMYAGVQRDCGCVTVVHR